jgi:glycine/serine hydroxymethyltransferase
MKEKEMLQVGSWIAEALNNHKDGQVLARIRRQVRELADAFPLYPELREPVGVA